MTCGAASAHGSEGAVQPWTFAASMAPPTCLICTAMATMGTKTLLGLVVAALAVAAVQAMSVTMYNPSGLSVDVLVDDKDIKVETGMVTVDITLLQQYVQVKVAGEVMEVAVQDGDVFVLIPDPSDPLNAVLALKVDVGGTVELVTPLPSLLPEVESIPATPNPSPLP